MKRHAPATTRNREPIADVLAGVLPESGLVLEVASGTGEHIAAFAERFAGLTWQPSDPDGDSLASIADWCADLPNVLPPVALDAAAPAWPVARADAVLCINMVHISSWSATVGLFTQSSKLLPQGAPLILYGPYFRKDHPTAPTNLAFDESLRARNAEWGLRWLEDVTELAEAKGFALEGVYEMPANNLTLLYRRT
jgi:SAM-dependent methyltransferase